MLFAHSLAFLYLNDFGISSSGKYVNCFFLYAETYKQSINAFSGSAIKKLPVSLYQSNPLKKEGEILWIEKVPMLVIILFV